MFVGLENRDLITVNTLRGRYTVRLYVIFVIRCACSLCVRCFCIVFKMCFEELKKMKCCICYKNMLRGYWNRLFLDREFHWAHMLEPSLRSTVLDRWATQKFWSPCLLICWSTTEQARSVKRVTARGRKAKSLTGASCNSYDVSARLASLRLTSINGLRRRNVDRRRTPGSAPSTE